MKTSQDPRHRKRQRLTQELFSAEFHEQPFSRETQEILQKKTFLDEKIREAATNFPVEKINKIDLAILRLAVYELMLERKAPPHVIIDEAVELAKEFANETSPAFINGVLAHILTNEKLT